jgi:glutamate-1-semialdehyde 2,1-aminomutase
MLSFHFAREPIVRPEQTWLTGEPAKRVEQLRALLHFDLLAAGQYFARRGFMSLSLPMTGVEHERFAAAFEEFLEVRKPLLA